MAEDSKLLVIGLITLFIGVGIIIYGVYKHLFDPFFIFLMLIGIVLVIIGLTLALYGRYKAGYIER